MSRRQLAVFYHVCMKIGLLLGAIRRLRCWRSSSSVMFVAIKDRRKERLQSVRVVWGVKIVLYWDEKHTMQAQLRWRRENFDEFTNTRTGQSTQFMNVQIGARWTLASVTARGHTHDCPPYF
jgi:hypothetical protein